MAKRVFIRPYKMGSMSANSLADVLGCNIIRLQKSRYAPRSTDMIINWGNGARSDYENLVDFLNPSDSVAVAGNKLYSLRAMQKDGIKTVPFSVSKVEATGWGVNNVVCRDFLRGHSGAGIHIFPADQDLPDCPLYTQYIKRTSEYRVHVFWDTVLCIQIKLRRRERLEEFEDDRIRNLANGWVYCHAEPSTVPVSVTEEAIKSVESLNLDFGAVDVIWNRVHGAFVLEVNTAPGLTGRTLEAYVNKFRQIYEEN